MKSTHGMSGTPEYYAWLHLRSRSLKEGRAISDEFMRFENFIDDVGLKPSSIYTLGLKDESGAFAPGNIKWFEQHGMKGSGAYSSWANLKNRCTNPNADNYKYYGGRGITYCDRWERFENFYADMGDKPGPEYSIDRIDPDGNYEPSNCKWETKSQQSKNTRIQKLQDNGVYFCKTKNKWKGQISVNGERIILGSFDSKEDAIAARKAAEKKYWGKE